jgi:3-oxoacyl-[acyl-carrier protein] reductase
MSTQFASHAGPPRLAGRVAIVTGGGAGIGRAICLRLAAEGARVAVLDLNQSTAERTVTAGGGEIALALDVSNSGAVDAAVTRVERELGPLEAFVNNAGASGAEHGQRVGARLAAQRAEAAGGRIETPLDALVRLTDEEWRQLLAVHLDGTFYGTRAAARAMAPRRRGAIVNMASICGIEGCTGHPHYSAAKAGIIGLTRSAAKELIFQGIRVNALAPGFVDTGTGSQEVNENRASMAARTPAGRLATPEEIAAAVAFLVSDEASYFVGATLSPNGGLVTAV